ncbi:MAG: DUF4364 family protein [Clostridia bacterium]|nr:DUF4364 family protein [Clostridia bacterium]
MSDYYFNYSVDLKLIILFIAQNFKRPVTISDVTDIVISKGYAEYFESAQCFSELEESGLIIPASRKGTFIVTEKGLSTSKLLLKELPFTVRESLLDAIKTVRRKETEAHSLTAEYKENKTGSFDVFCEITESGFHLFSMSVTLPTKDDARRATANFKKNAEQIYAEIIKNLS